MAFDWNRAKRTANNAFEEIIDVADGVLGMGETPEVLKWAKGAKKKALAAISIQSTGQLRTIQVETQRVINAALGKKTPATKVQRAAKEMGTSRMSMSEINPFLKLSIPAAPAPAASAPSSDAPPAAPGGSNQTMLIAAAAILAGVFFLTRKK